MSFGEPLEGVFNNSGVVILDFAQIPSDAPPRTSIKHFFNWCADLERDPRSPEMRQEFNDLFLATYGLRYLIGRYREDRTSMLAGSQMLAEGRTVHLGIDVFASDLEPIYSPSDGQIVTTGYEDQKRGYGHYLTIKPKDREIFLFLGHLAQDLPNEGEIKKGDRIARLGNFDENGGWSRHLHLQIMTEPPIPGETPIGYSSKQDIELNSQKFPDPKNYFPDWIY